MRSLSVDVDILALLIFGEGRIFIANDPDIAISGAMVVVPDLAKDAEAVEGIIIIIVGDEVIELDLSLVIGGHNRIPEPEQPRPIAGLRLDLDTDIADVAQLTVIKIHFIEYAIYLPFQAIQSLHL